MTSESLGSTEQLPATLRAQLLSTRWAARIVFVFLVVVTLMFLLMFVYQYQCDIQPGIRYLDTPGAIVHVFSHLSRAVMFAVLALATRHYLLTLRAIQSEQDGATELLGRSARFAWRSAVGCACLVIAFGVFALIFNQREQASYGDYVAQLDDVVERDDVFGDGFVDVELRLAEFEARAGLTASTTAGGHPIWLHPEAILGNKQIVKAAAVEVGGEAFVDFTFNSEGASALKAATGKHRGRPLAFIVEGQVMRTPIVEWEISEAARFAGFESIEEAIRFTSSLSGI